MDFTPNVKPVVDTMIELRNYQRDLLKRVQPALEPNGARVMMQLPTGGGKTVIAAHLLKDYLTDGRKAVWLTHRTELSVQTRKMLRDAAVVKAWYVRRPSMQALSDGVVILMAQTVGLRARNPNVWSKYDHNDMMIIDEAHHSAASGYERAISRWPGRVLGMTATPWHLSVKEGFDHLFEDMVCGQQVTDLQSGDYLCEARVLIPPPDARILGGDIGSIGDYTESGIEHANEDRPDVMTAGALRIWQESPHGRQTIIYAVSVRHARNLARVFSEAGVPTGLMLGDTPLDERAATVEKFLRGNLNVLVNVAVATEGFDLPDASCVLVARPTESLTLYLQMVGRGMRPKSDGGDCLILDLAGNSLKHGLPEDNRKWSLTARGAQGDGEAPVTWCEHCGTASPASSHNCQYCEAPFGKDCPRCGKWRAWKRWSLESACEYIHDRVCDLCHRDAYLQARLPVTDQMQRLAGQDDVDEEEDVTVEYDDLDERLAELIRELLNVEHDRVEAQKRARQNELRDFITREGKSLGDDEVLFRQFEAYLELLPPELHPVTRAQQSRMFGVWEGERRAALAAKRDELAGLRAQSIGRSLIFDRVQTRIMRVLHGETKTADVLTINSPSPRRETFAPVTFGAGRHGQAYEWVPLPEIRLTGGEKPSVLRFPDGTESSVNSWADVLVEIANWLIRKNKFSDSHCPFTLGRAKNYFINRTPHHSGDRDFKTKRSLANGMFINAAFNTKNLLKHCTSFLTEFGETPSQFYIKLS